MIKLLLIDVAYLILNALSLLLYSAEIPCNLPLTSSKPIPDSTPSCIKDKLTNGISKKSIRPLFS